MSAQASSPLGTEAAVPRRTPDLELTLHVTDAEVVSELRRFADAADRERYALNALRVGVLALRAAAGHLDTEALKHAGDEVFQRIDALLKERATSLTGEVTHTLEKYLDPSTGVMPQRLGELVKKDGELDRVLARWVNREDSMLARTLADQLGQDSPVFRLLSPTDAGGLLQQLAKLLEERLRAQREGLLQQFSLDDKTSALSRFLGEVEGRQGDFRKSLDERMQALTAQFSLDNPDSAITRFRTLMEDLRERNEKFQGEVRGLLERLDKGQQLAARTTLGGFEFEDALGRVLQEESQRTGDVWEAVGETTGVVRGSKVGDFVVTFGGESAAAGARVVWEAKRAAGYTLRAALDEIAAARQNRAAQIGVFVFAAQSAPEGLEPFTRYGQDLVVKWDLEAEPTGLLVRAAIGVARALAVRESKKSAEGEAALAEIDHAVAAIQRQAAYLEDFRKWAETVKSSGEKIIDRAERMKKDLDKELERLSASVETLKTASGAGASPV